MFFCANASAKIIVKGNQRIDEQGVLSLINKSKNANLTRSEIDSSLKKIFASELFVDAKIYQENSDFIIEVLENPIISEVKIIGNKKIEDDVLLNELLLKKRGIYTKFKLESDLKRINAIYLKSGRFLTKIEPKLIQKEENRVEVIFDISEGPKAKIADIYFIGNNEFSDSELTSEITTKPSRWYRFLSSSDIYDSDRIEFDREKLRRFYGTNGYADFTTISATAQILPTKDKFFITFLLEEGIKYRFGEIKIVNQIEKFDEELLKKAILIKSKKIYNSDLIEQTVDKMVEIMSDNSYAFANIEPILKRNKEQKTIDIDFVVEESPRVYIDSIVIKGNTRTMDEVIRRELRVRDGDAYNLNKINRSKQRIQNLGFFDDVQFDTKRIGESDKVIIEISVKEKKTGELNFGIGYSTVDQATANIGLKERNFRGTGRELGINLQRSKFSLSGNVDYSKPYFMNRPVNVGVNVFAFQSDKRNTLVYDQASKGLSLRANYFVTEYLGHSVSYFYRDEEISSVDIAASITIQQLAGQFVSSGISQNFSYDRRNNVFDPREGYYISLGQEYAGIGGDIKTIKHTGSAGFYQPLFNRDFVLKLLLQGGKIDGLGQDVRNNLGFFLGGNNFRGFEFAGLGPRVVTNGTAVGGNAVGGNLYYVATAEMRFPLGLPKELGIYGILFSDNGTVKGVDATTKSFSEIADDGSMRSSYGLSIAWSSPMGPIRFDFSKVAKQEKYDRTQNFRFSFGSTF
jgi:outer membrane protein insertion porin family